MFMSICYLSHGSVHLASMWLSGCPDTSSCNRSPGWGWVWAPLDIQTLPCWQWLSCTSELTPQHPHTIALPEQLSKACLHEHHVKGPGSPSAHPGNSSMGGVGLAMTLASPWEGSLSSPEGCTGPKPSISHCTLSCSAKQGPSSMGVLSSGEANTVV